MPFSLGAIELLFLVSLAILVGLLCAIGHRYYRVAVVAFVCAALAALISPADIVSMMLLGVTYAGIFVFGSRYRLNRPATPV